MLTFSLGKHLKFSDPSIFTLSCYLISGGSTAVFPHSGRAAFLLLLHWLTTSCLFWLPASHCFVVLCAQIPIQCWTVFELCWGNLWPVVWAQNHDSQTLPRALSLPVCPSGSIILAWRWSKELLWLIAWWICRIRFISHDADKCLHFCSSDHPVHTALSQICPSLGSIIMPLNLFLICVVLPCVRSMDTAHWKPFSQTTAVQL